MRISLPLKPSLAWWLWASMLLRTPLALTLSDSISLNLGLRWSKAACELKLIASRDTVLVLFLRWLLPGAEFC